MPLTFLYGPEDVSRYRNPALVIAHPGHELKVFGWLADFSPRVYILTDGSGGNGTSRLPSTTKLLRQSGSVPDGFFGFLPDAAVYAALLEGNFSTFLGIVDWLAGSLAEHNIDMVAGDAVEGFNPAHDICRALLNGAVAIAEQRSGHSIANYEFCLTEWEQHCEDPHDGRCLHLRLDDQRLQQKLCAAREYTELRIEVDQAIASRGEEYFRVECLRKVTDPFPELIAETKPYYETVGAQRVAQGKYGVVIRYGEHMVPALQAIRGCIAARCPPADSVPVGTRAASAFMGVWPAAAVRPT